jgi:hypothetical protein
VNPAELVEARAASPLPPAPDRARVDDEPAAVVTSGEGVVTK